MAINHTTGAGISTSAGIGDFRGKDGKWIEEEREKTYGELQLSSSIILYPLTVYFDEFSIKHAALSG